ncbi:hypothetical protein KJ797_04385 [Patescibacteria group bacterium]|nr:hypothetical protein [Patescibacteria group bacterium]
MFSARGGGEPELNREIRRLDDRLDVPAHLLHLHDAVPGHRLERPGEIAAAAPRRCFQLLERFGLPLQDGLQEQLVLIAQDLCHRLQRFKPDLGLIGPAPQWRGEKESQNIPETASGDFPMHSRGLATGHEKGIPGKSRAAFF